MEDYMYESMNELIVTILNKELRHCVRLLDWIVGLFEIKKLNN